MQTSVSSDLFDNICLARSWEVEHFASFLQILIGKYHYSLADIAKQTGIPYNVLSSLKQRKRDIKKANVEMVVKLSQFFNVRIETIAEIAI